MPAGKAERREAFGPSPYGGIVDLRQATDIALLTSSEPEETLPDKIGRQILEIKEWVRKTYPGSKLYRQIEVVAAQVRTPHATVMARAAAHARSAAYAPESATTPVQKSAWVAVSSGDIDALAKLADGIVDVDAAAIVRAAVTLAERWRSHLDSEIRLGPDWKAWEKDLKKAAVRGAEPLSDADLHILRHAVADNHCKSSEGERSEVRSRVQRLMERHARALLLRLEMAEKATVPAPAVTHTS